jgi:hypothetical protein
MSGKFVRVSGRVLCSPAVMNASGTSERTDGMYWVRPKIGEWTVARYLSVFGSWNVVGAAGVSLSDDDWEEIGERLDPAP